MFVSVTKKVISGWGDGPEFTYVIDRTGGGVGTGGEIGQPQQPPHPPVRLKRGVSPRGVFQKAKSGSSGGTEIRRIDFERDAPDAASKKKPRLRTTTCCKVT